MHHPQVVQSPISNDCLKVKIDGHTEPQLVPKLLLQVSVRELHKNLVSDADNGAIKQSRYEENNIIISGYTLRSLLPPQFKKCHQDTRLCVVENVAYLPKVCIHNYYHGVIVIFKNSSISSKMLKTEDLGGKKIRIYETYKNKLMPHWRRIYAKSYEMPKGKMCAYSQSDHTLPHWKCVY